jgi:hypothetical protein
MNGSDFMGLSLQFKKGLFPQEDVVVENLAERKG